MDTYQISIYTAVVISGCLFTLIVVLFAWGMIRGQKRYFQKEGAAYEAEIKLLKEKQRIAADLHDELGPLLSSIGMQIRLVIQQHPETADELKKVEEQVQYVAEGMRRIAMNLLPDLFVQKGLEACIKDFALECRAVYQLEVETIVSIKTEPVVEARVHLMRILQEAVHNSIKHSGATTVSIRLTEKKKKLYVLCSDNGKGMAETKPLKGGIGLQSIRHRTMLLRGRMQCVSDERGTHYFIEIPINQWSQSKL